MNENDWNDSRETCFLLGGPYDGREIHVYPFDNSIWVGDERPHRHLDGTDIDWSEASPETPVKSIDWSSMGPIMTYVRLDRVTFIPQ
jgi:hypothetical protein